MAGLHADGTEVGSVTAEWGVAVFARRLQAELARFDAWALAQRLPRGAAREVELLRTCLRRLAGMTAAAAPVCAGCGAARQEPEELFCAVCREFLPAGRAGG